MFDYIHDDYFKYVCFVLNKKTNKPRFFLRVATMTEAVTACAAENKKLNSGFIAVWHYDNK